MGLGYGTDRATFVDTSRRPPASHRAIRKLRWETERRDSLNRCAVPTMRVDEQLPAHGLQPLPHAGQAEPGSLTAS